MHILHYTTIGIAYLFALSLDPIESLFADDEFRHLLNEFIKTRTETPSPRKKPRSLSRGRRKETSRRKTGLNRSTPSRRSNRSISTRRKTKYLKQSELTDDIRDGLRVSYLFVFII